MSLFKFLRGFRLYAKCIYERQEKRTDAVTTLEICLMNCHHNSKFYCNVLFNEKFMQRHFFSNSTTSLAYNRDLG